MIGPLRPTKIDIPIDDRMKAIEIIGVTLGTFIDLYYQIKQAHWNIEGHHFMPLHLMFDEFGDEMVELVDEVAERIKQLGGTALGTIRLASQFSILPEFPTVPFQQILYLEALRDRYAMVVKHLRQAAKELGEIEETTQNYYLEVAKMLDKRLWFLQAHLMEDDEIPTREPNSSL